LIGASPGSVETGVSLVNTLMLIENVVKKLPCLGKAAAQMK
jgi:hypothetical protein